MSAREPIQQAVALARRIGHVWLATVDEQGQPHMAIGVSSHVSGYELTVAAWFCPRTLHNLEQNPRVTVAIWDPVSDTGYQMLGHVEAVHELHVLGCASAGGASPAVRDGCASAGGASPAVRDGCASAGGASPTTWDEGAAPDRAVPATEHALLIAIDDVFALCRTAHSDQPVRHASPPAPAPPRVSSGPRAVRAAVDRAVCIGAASCVGIAPQYFMLDPDGLAHVSAGDVLPADEELLRQAAHSCPVQAITLFDADGRPIDLEN